MFTPSILSKTSCFERKNFPGVARCLYRVGVNTIPLNAELLPAVKYEELQDRGISETDISRWEKEGKYKSLAILCGRVSGITCIDIDDLELFCKSFKTAELLINSCKFSERTRNGGLHLYFKYSPIVESRKSFKKLWGVDFLNSGLSNCSPSSCAKGSYKLIEASKIVEMPEKFAEELKLRLIHERLPELLDLLSEIYVEGYRQNVNLFLAGFLKKVGFTQEKVEEILEEVWVKFEPNLTKEESIQRLSAIKGTFKKSEAQTIKGISGLQEIAENTLGLENGIKLIEKLQMLFNYRSSEVVNMEDLKKAKELLNDPKLFDKIIAYFDCEYLGRVKEKKLLYLICLFTKLGFSTLCIISGDTSTGKSSLVKTITSAFPEEQKLAFNATSEKFFLYLNQPLERKILTIFELCGAMALPFLKTFVSEGVSSIGTVTKIKGELRPVEIKKSTEGLVIITTTTKQTFDEETINRGFLITLETTQDFIKEILNFQPQPINYRELQILYKLLEPKDVIIPYQAVLASAFPTDKPRRVRDFKKILNLIKAHALLYQYQREQKENSLIAELADYEAIFNLADLIVPAFSEITPMMREFVEWLKPKKTTSEVNKYPNASLSSVKRWKKQLLELGFIEKMGDEVIVVENPSVFSGLPKPEDIKNLMSQLANKPQTVDNTKFEMAQQPMSHDEPMSLPEETIKPEEQNNGSWLKQAQTGMSQPEALKNKDLNHVGSKAHKNNNTNWLDELEEVSEEEL
jgi:hypothetical protein